MEKKLLRHFSPWWQYLNTFGAQVAFPGVFRWISCSCHKKFTQCFFRHLFRRFFPKIFSDLFSHIFCQMFSQDIPRSFSAVFPVVSQPTSADVFWHRKQQLAGWTSASESSCRSDSDIFYNTFQYRKKENKCLKDVFRRRKQQLAGSGDLCRSDSDIGDTLPFHNTFMPWRKNNYVWNWVKHLAFAYKMC